MITKNNYIPQIDGLRAVAVLSVILFHANFSVFNINFSGGFFGVDIFFVISGYLISRLIISEINSESSFNFKNFYIRRIRRILPALLTVALVTYPFAWLLLLPVSLMEYVGSLISGIFFTSNLFFYFSGAEYDSTPSLYKPLLHYWSLSVEEQFYIIYPLTLFIVYKFLRKNLTLFFTFIAFLSFVLSLYLSVYDNSLNFYLFPTRIWELLIGAFAAKLNMENNKITNSRYQNLFQLLGVSLIIFSILFLKNFEQNWAQNNILYKLLLSHPGLLTLIPVMGTFLVIIFYKKKNFINKFLSLKPIVFIGLISYSLYLWHVPIFSFIRISTIDINSPIEYLILILIIFLISILSYYFIEKPFRNKNITTLKNLSFYLLSIVLILLFLSFNTSKHNGYSNLVPDYFKEFKINDKSGNPLFKKLRKKEDVEKIDSTNKSKNPFFDTVLMIGDSHAGDFEDDMKKVLSKRETNLINLSYLNIFSLDFTNVRPNGEKRFIKDEFDEILNEQNVSTIILMSRFPFYWHKSGFDSEQGADGIEIATAWAPVPYFLDKNNKRLEEKNRKEMIEKSFNESLIKILNMNINVIIVYPVPEVGLWVPDTLAGRILPRLKIKSMLDNFLDDTSFINLPKTKYLTTSYDLYLKRNKEVFKMLDKTQHPNLYRIYPHKKLCDYQIKNRCITHTKNNIYYRDHNHLSIDGRKLIIPEFIDVFDRIK